jgi:hypothetical protein
MPYLGHETLVFKSNTGILDTVFLLKRDTLLSDYSPFSFNGFQYELLSIYAKHTDPTGGQHRYLENRIFELKKDKEKHARLEIMFLAENAVFYQSGGFKIDSLEKEQPTTYHTKYARYDDVYLFKGDDVESFKHRSDYIKRLYWSRSNGVIRYDKMDSMYWELANKY